MSASAVICFCPSLLYTPAFARSAFILSSFLLMPELRLVVMGGKMMVSYSSGRADSYSEYGHKPREPGDEEHDKRDGQALRRLRAEWAIRHRPKYAAYNHDFGRSNLREDSST